MIETVRHVGVGDTDDAESSVCKNLISGFVVFELVSMDATVNFNDEPRCVAVEIDDEAVDELLAAETSSIKASAPKR